MYKKNWNQNEIKTALQSNYYNDMKMYNNNSSFKIKTLITYIDEFVKYHININAYFIIGYK